MTDRSVRVVLSAQVAGYKSAMDQAKASTLALRDANEALARARKEGDHVATQAAENAVATAKAANIAARDQLDLMHERRQAAGTLSTALMGVGVAMLAGPAAAVKAYADFDAQMSNVAATGADAKGSINELREAALKAGADTVFSAKEAAEGIEELMKAGLSAKDVLSGGLRGALDLAVAGEISVAEAAEITAKTLAQFGLEGSKASHVADLLAAGANKSVGTVHDLGEALKMSGTVAAQYGISVEETTGVLAMFAQNALIGSDAGTSFKQSLLMLAKPTDAASVALQQYNINAYDSQGQFVGMANLAGQLKEKLGGLSQEQQNAALKTIFGADAIRAANILMKEGAEGTKEWTQKVHDSAFAQRLAAERLNNLKGDIEQLTGSLETLLIKSGEGANGPLREFVQGITALVNCFSGLSGPTQSTILTIAAVGGGLALLTGVSMKAAVALGEVKVALEVMGVSAEITSGIMKGLKLSMGIASIALIGLTAVLAAVAKDQAKTQAATRDYSAAIDEQGRVVKQTAREIAAKHLLESGDLDRAQKLGIATSDLTDALLGNADANARVNDAIQKGLHTAKTQKQLGKETVLVKSEEEKAAEELANSLHVESEAIKNNEESKKKEIEASGKSVDAKKTLAGASDTVTETLEAENKALKEQANGIDVLMNATQRQANSMLALSGSAIGVESAITSASKKILENGKVVDWNTQQVNLQTEAGQESQTQLDNLGQAILKRIDVLTKEGKSTGEITELTARAKSEYIRLAEGMGYSKEKATEMANAFVKTTEQTKEVTRFTTEFKDAINQLPQDKRVTVQALLDRGQVAEARAILDQTARERNAVIRVRLEDGGRWEVNPENGGIPMYQRRADGGIIGGYSPHPRADNILIAATAGEFMMSNAAGDKAGRDVLDRINAGAFSPERLRWAVYGGRLPAFADGGQVGPRVYMQGDTRPAYVTNHSSSSKSLTVPITMVAPNPEVATAVLSTKITNLYRGL